jgi:HPt (histidine-containing phosphotransfer) domain-containing protein
MIMMPRSDTWDARPDIPADGHVRESLPAEVLNLRELNDRCMGNHEFLQRILGRFRQRVPEELAELEKSLETRDMEQMARVAHRLKGSSASVSANGLEQAAAAVEDLSRAGRIADIPAHMKRLRDEWARCHLMLPSVDIA